MSPSQKQSVRSEPSTPSERIAWLEGYLSGCGLSDEAIDTIIRSVREYQAQRDVYPPKGVPCGMSNDCQCPPGTICNNTACPRALKWTCTTASALTDWRSN